MMSLARFFDADIRFSFLFRIRYYLKRLRHSAGEVTCLSIDEYVSLPKECTLSVRYHSAVPAQGFFSIKKM